MPDPRDFQVYHVVFKTICLLARHPNEVVVRTLWTNEGASFTVCMHPNDVETLFGGQSQIEESLQHVIGEMGARLGRRFGLTVDRESEKGDQVQKSA